MATRALPALVVYSRKGCHLCDEMFAGLRSLQARVPFAFDVVDVGSDPELEARYGEDVPVLTGDGSELCRHRLDADRVSTWLRGLRQGLHHAAAG